MTIPEFTAIREAFRQLLDHTNSTPETYVDGDYLFRQSTGQWWQLDGEDWKPAASPFKKSIKPPIEPSP